jgi:hypothetical protein
MKTTSFFPVVSFLAALVLTGAGCSGLRPICDTTGHCFACVVCGMQLPEDQNDMADEDSTPTPETSGPIAGPSLKWYSGDKPIEKWKETVRIKSATIGRTVSWEYETPPGPWKRTKKIKNHPNACIGWTTEIEGEQCGVIAEWLLPGQNVQARKIFKSDRGNKKVFKGKLRNFEPKSGQVFHIFVCGLNWAGQANVQERSNAVKVVYP